MSDIELLNALLFFVILILGYILPSLVNRKLAIKKGRDKIGWMLSVFFLSWWSTLILSSLPSLKLNDKEDEDEKMMLDLKNDFLDQFKN